MGRSISIVASLILLSLILPFVVMEAYFQMTGLHRFDLKDCFEHRVFVDQEKHLLHPNPGEVVEYNHEINGEEIYRFRGTFDHIGRRFTGPLKGTSVGHAFFGGSYTFGSGLYDEQTVPYLFSELSGLDTYNYGRSGFSPSGALLQLLRLDLDKQLPEQNQKIHVTYIYYPFQLRRINPSLQWVGKNGPQNPIFQPTGSSLSYRGTFAQAFPWVSRAFYFLGGFHLAHYLPEVHWPLGFESPQKMLCGFVNSMAAEAKSKLQTRLAGFHFVNVWHNDVKSQKDLLENLGDCLTDSVDHIQISIDMSMEEASIHFPKEVHPNELFNRQLAEKLVEKLK